MNAAISKELKIRLRIEGIYNRRPDEFDDKQSYDDYLEEREDIIFKLLEGIDKEETDEKVRQYYQANQDSILRNEAQKGEERKRLADELRKALHAHTKADEHTEPAVDVNQFDALQYTANLPGAQTAFGAAPLPVGVVPAGGDFTAVPPINNATEQMKMAAASGWSAEIPRRRALLEAFSEVFAF